VPDAVVDTGPLIHLHEVDSLELITAVFSNLHLPEYVFTEIHNDLIRQFIRRYTDQITIHRVLEPELFTTKDSYSAFQLHLADLAVLNLLIKIADAFAVTDDLSLRRAIESKGRIVVGTIGILFRAYKLELINNPQLTMLINRIFNDSTLYLNRAFKARVLEMIDSL